MANILFCQATDGKRLAYAIDGEGPAILFPAWWISHVEKDWAHDRFRVFFSALARDHLVVRYDRVGVGLSDRMRDLDDMTVEREVTDLEHLIDHLELDEVTLFGVSCGGPTAVTYAVRHPTRVRSIIMHGSYLRGCTIGNPEVRAAMLGLVRASWGLGSKTLASIFTPDVSPDAIRRITVGIWAAPVMTVGHFVRDLVRTTQRYRSRTRGQWVRRPVRFLTNWSIGKGCLICKNAFTWENGLPSL
ncbi:MAG: alpha/beta hydrolase [Polyangiales bacterium]